MCPLCLNASNVCVLQVTPSPDVESMAGEAVGDFKWAGENGTWTETVDEIYSDGIVLAHI